MQASSCTLAPSNFSANRGYSPVIRWLQLPTILVVWLLYFFTGVNAFCQEIKATTEDGKAIILDPDGTWSYSDAKEPSSLSDKGLPQFFKPESATTLLRGKRVKYGLWYDHRKWVLDQEIDNTSAEFELTHVEGDRYAVIIPERIQIPLETLRIAAITNAKKVAPDARIPFEEKRIVNNRKILCLKMDATIQGIPVSYINYYYSGKAGAVQVMAYTGQNLLDEYTADLMDLLNGFEVYE
jgi:hypothetical protein